MTLFSESNKKTKELHFAIRLSILSKPFEPEEMKNFFRGLKNAYPSHFAKCDLLLNENRGGAIAHPENKRAVIVTQENIAYRESQKLKNYAFDKICENIYNFFIVAREVELQDVKIVGKVGQFEFRTNDNSVEMLSKRTNLYMDADLKKLRIYTTILKDDKNIHIDLGGEIPSKYDDDDDDMASKMTVKLDINNHNQVSGVSENILAEIQECYSDFEKTELLDVLNKNFG